MLLKKENHIHRFARRIPEYNARRQYFEAWHQPSVAISQLFFNKTTSFFLFPIVPKAPLIAALIPIFYFSSCSFSLTLEKIIKTKMTAALPLSCR